MMTMATKIASSMFTALVLISVSGALAADQKPSEFVLCKNQKNVRTLRVIGDTKSSNCKVTYSKGGVEEQVGDHSSKESCNSILDRMKSTLQESKWACKSVSATVTTSSEVSRQ